MITQRDTRTGAIAAASLSFAVLAGTVPIDPARALLGRVDSLPAPACWWWLIRKGPPAPKRRSTTSAPFRPSSDRPGQALIWRAGRFRAGSIVSKPAAGSRRAAERLSEEIELLPVPGPLVSAWLAV